MIFLYFLTLLSWVVYSYSQIDLNITLLQLPWFLSFQHQMIQLGYFDRPLSTAIFLVLLAFSYILYFLLVVRKNSLKTLLIITGVIAFTCLLAYPAFSYDIFNYMFDARIVTFYHQNPWTHKALDFPADLWTRFMHWTHRNYPYGPSWIAITLLPSFLGLGKFIPTLLLFKLLFIASYLASTYLIYRILKRTNPVKAIKGTMLFAANPLIIIESLLSPHNESLTLSFLLLGIYLMLLKRGFGSLVSTALSAGIKYSTAPLLLLDGYLVWTKRKIEWSERILVYIVIMVLVTMGVIYFREAYPWYLIPIVGLAALLPDFSKLQFGVAVLSIAFLLRYAPFLYVGDYTPQVQFTKNLIMIVPVVLILPLLTFRALLGKYRKIS